MSIDLSSLDNEENGQIIPWILQLLTSNYPILSTSLELDLMDKSIVRVVNHNMGLPFVSEDDVAFDDIDWTTKNKLDERRILNWRTEGCSLYPINTNVGDNNELGMISKQTLNNVLRYLTKISTIILERLTSNENGHECRRGHNQLTNCRSQSNLMKSQNPHSNQIKPQNPQRMSIGVLAHLMSRPIVVLTDSSQVAGIYLPTSRSPHDCSKDPIVLSYHLGQYSPLVGIIDKGHESIPCLVILSLTSSGYLPKPVRTFKPIDESSPSYHTMIFDYLNVDMFAPNASDFAAIVTNAKNSYNSFHGGRLFKIVGNQPITCDNSSVTMLNGNTTHDVEIQQQSDCDCTCGEQVEETTILSHCIAEGCEREIGLTTFPFCDECNQKRNSKGKNGKIRISNNIKFVKV